MLLRQKPKNEDKYIKVDSDRNKELQNLGYQPMYCYNGLYYYLIEVLKVGE